jgi:hypothetical protein
MTRRPTLERRLKRQERRLQFEQELLARRAEVDDESPEEAESEEADAAADSEPQASASPDTKEVAPAIIVTRPEESPPTPSALAPESDAEAAAPEPGMPTERSPQQEFVEENCRWRQRGPEDYDWDDDERPRLNECLHEYDPLESE